jgi:hypothetical protein
MLGMSMVAPPSTMSVAPFTNAASSGTRSDGDDRGGELAGDMFGRRSVDVGEHD